MIGHHYSRTAWLGIVLLLWACTDQPYPTSAEPAPNTAIADVHAPSVVTVDLGALGGTASLAYDINDRGEVVGFAETSNGEVHAFLWRAESGMKDLGTLGGTMSQAVGISNAGHVVGFSRTTSGEIHAFLWTEQTGMQDLGTLGGPSSAAWGRVNSRGEVAGESRDINGSIRGFRWNAGVMKDIGGLGPYGAQATDINELGEIVGSSIDQHAVSTPFISFRDGKMRALPLGNADAGWGLGVNNRDIVVGKLIFGTDDPVERAALWIGFNQPRLLPLLSGRNSIAAAINDDGHAVGWADIEQPKNLLQILHAVVWWRNATSALDLTPHQRHAAALAINKGGVIVGTRDNPSFGCCRDRATLWRIVR